MRTDFRSTMHLAVPVLEEHVKEDDVATYYSTAQLVTSHVHTCIELGYVLKGDILHNIDGKTCRVNHGEYFLVGCNQRHSYFAVPGTEIRIFNILFHPRLISSEFNDSYSLLDLFNHYLFSVSGHKLTTLPQLNVFEDPNEYVHHNALSILRECNEREFGWRESIRSLIDGIFVQSLRRIYQDDSEKARMFSVSMAQYVQKYFSEPIKITDSYPSSNYTASYLSKQFRLETGMTFTEYVKRIRIEASCKLLLNTDKPIKEIAELSGYRDSSFFHKTFQQFMGCSPAQYRKLHNLVPSSPIIM